MKFYNNTELLLEKKESAYFLPLSQLATITTEELESISIIDFQINLYIFESDIFLAPQRIEGSVNSLGDYDSYLIKIQQEEDQLQLNCNCSNKDLRLCAHLATAIKTIQQDENLQLAFKHESRLHILQNKAKEFGWENMENLDHFFQIEYSYGRLHIKPSIELLTYNSANKASLTDKLLTRFSLPIDTSEQEATFLIIEKSRYKKHLSIFLMCAARSQSKIGFKSPILKVDLLEQVKQAKNQEDTLYYLALFGLSNYTFSFDNYQRVLQNPVALPAYLMEERFGNEKITPQKLQSLNFQESPPTVRIEVREVGNFYSMNCKVNIAGQEISSEKLQVFEHLFLFRNCLYCVRTEAESKVLQFFYNNKHQVYLRREQFDDFKADFLDQLENNVAISYSFIKKAPAKMLKEQQLDQPNGFIIYLTELQDFVCISPAVSYGEIEVPVLSRRTIYSTQADGTRYALPRDEFAEHTFIRNIQAQHPDFGQHPEVDYYYLHKNVFLDSDWFLDAFEAWRNEGYRIMGFHKLKNNRYNPHKIHINLHVQSGSDWFDIHCKISFGDQEVHLRDLQKALVNPSKYIPLDDGSLGILPEEWIKRFQQYFRAGEIKNEKIRSAKSNFLFIDECFEKEQLSENTQLEIMQFKEKLANFQGITKITVPSKLQTNLRDYQIEGLQWLNFLDEFGFGGCLADDMGLGKTIQIIAYFLLQLEKGKKGSNLVVVPTSLLFNWQQELARFAPNLRYLVLHGTKRNDTIASCLNYDVVLTSYGTLLADIAELQKIHFNVLILDESQAIKNPNSQRYKAVKLLQARQRIVLTGTPIENNTFDLYAQLSLAVPGLLGSAKRFATDYSTPIDKFGDSKRAQELQRKIAPFILRRTKKQVANELPEKTEMIIYCEMGTEQRAVYEAYKREFQKYLKGIQDDKLPSVSLHILQGLTKLRQLCNAPALLADDAFYSDESAKIDELLRQIDKLQSEHKILVFSQFVGMLDRIKVRLEQAGIAYAYLSGKTQQREEQVHRFQNEKHVRVFLISLKAGGTGLNLTQADYVFLVDPWWNPAVENQAIDRAYRLGQSQHVIAIRLLTPNSIEEKIVQLQQRKQHLADELIGTDQQLFKQLNKDDLLNLLT